MIRLSLHTPYTLLLMKDFIFFGEYQTFDMYSFYFISILQNTMDHSLQIALEKRKQQQWTHLEHQYSTYRKNFQGRPLLPKQVNTFLEFSSIITQLIPTFNHHYFQALTTDQSAFISQITSAIFNDLQAKLKNLAHRIQKKEIEEINYKDVKTLCKVCLHQLREAEIKQAKQSLQGREILAHNILKIIREVQQTSDTFSREEDQRFFDDLRAVLKKKEEVIELCQTQTAEFISMIDDQLRDLLLNKDQLLMREDRSDQPTIKGYELKENVSRSLKTHLNEKIPEIINMVRASLKKWEDRQKKLRTVTIAVQTMDGQSIKIIEMKRKISSLEAELQQTNIERSQMSWSIQEKMLTIQKYQQEHTQMREQLSSKTYELHKQIKVLQEKNRKLREEIDKQKSRRYLENSQNNLKSSNSIAQIKETSLVDEPIDDSINMSIRRSKKKVTITSATKTGGKFYLPTLKKINVEDGEVTLLRESSKHYFESPQQSFTEVQASKAIVKDTYAEEKVVESAKVSLSKVQSKASLKSVSRQGKKLERVMTLDNGKDSIKQGVVPKKKNGKVRTERATEGRESLNESQTLPMVKQSINKVSNFNKKKQAKKLNNSPNKGVERSLQKQQAPKEQQKKIENVFMRQQAREVSQKLQEKVYERANSLSSAASNKSTDPNSKRIPRSSILKNHKNSTQETTVTLPSKPLKTMKSYLSNSFSKINEEIDKESYMTPLLAQETASFKDLLKLEENNPVKRHLLQIYKEISQREQSQQLSLQKFNEYFTNYIETVKQKSGLSEVDFSKNDCSAVDLQMAQENPHNAASHILASQQNRKEPTLDIQQHPKKLDLLKSKLLHQITKHKTKQTSLNTSYRPSLQYTADTARPPKTTNKPSPNLNNANLLVTLQTTLFFNEQIAFQYETNFSRKKQKVAQMTPCIEQYLKDLFAVFEQLKQEDEAYYHKISGFLRYPYSHSQNGFLQVDILKTLSFNAVSQFFLRILAYHKHCNDKRNETERPICLHLLSFMKILEDRLTASTRKLTNND